MSKKTFALIFFLFIITCGLLYFALKTPPISNQSKQSPTPTPLSVNAHTVLSLGLASATESSLLASGQTKTTQYALAIKIDTGDNKVNSVQLELGYDPQALTNVVITPGSFFTQPTTLLHNINTTDGRISYALAEQMDLPGKNGTGTVALISFSIQPTFTGKTTTLTFLPKTAVAADKILESVVRQKTGYTLTITPSPTIGTPSAK